MANNGAAPGDYDQDYGTTAGGPRGWLGGTNAPKGGDYAAAMQQDQASSQANTNAQTLANRANQTNAYGAGLNWTQGPDGQWTQSQSFGSGGLGQAAGGIMGQMGSQYSNPFKFSGPGVMSGDAARDQAISGAYSQATSRLDPQWNQREEAQRSQLLNQGLDPQSEAYKSAMGEFSRGRNDAYGSAMNSAIGQGTAAGDSMFRNSLAANQNAYGQQMGEYGLPMQLAQALQGFTGQASYNQAGKADSTNFLEALGLKDASRFQNWMANKEAEGDFWGGVGDLGNTALSFIPGLGKK